ncbi:Lrp/AsnC family transcriptional regulator [Pseudomonas sp. DTU_2021_1001937_2_SI_NGA_ILE_001]|uniref:Lrp/AsnC family transcriptional regulator n=1 Tax=Pseudomonas sp. DTU_2021_1001937_2_SI_NGA_ILE_001 TaxID=3077589 RepID=UPI0025D1D1C0|nr:Lrp/AsnC family transcriptional regulator [Pseudomonas sp. DTU_2021_1001937_2_SI_NGA_ILE_001]WNW11466.1 Lrp/AsnC family transcriptional regulator [Pseudomonas sp. DTU_2021_1001937_2_SI_NGA_ILE_001]
MDKFDKAILAILQQDCTVALATVAERVGLSNTACWRRIQKLEETGVILKRVALLSPKELGVPVTVFAFVRTGRHDMEWLETFHRRVSEIKEVVEFYRMAGVTDYLLRLAVPDIAGYDAVYKQLIQIPGIADVSSSFAMEQIKATTALPL